MEELQEIVDEVKSKEDVGERYMTVREWIEYEKREGMEEALAEGRAEGRAEGVLIGAVKICKEMNYTKEETKEQLIKSF